MRFGYAVISVIVHTFFGHFSGERKNRFTEQAGRDMMDETNTGNKYRS